MRVLHILNDVTDRGNGIVNAAVDLAIEQARQGLEVSVASAGGGYQQLLEREGVTHLSLDQSRHPAQLFRALLSLQRHLRALRPDIVHAHMRTGMLLAWINKPIHRYTLVGHVHNVHDRESVMMGLADRVIAVSQSVAATLASSGIRKENIRVVLNRTLGSKRIPSIAIVNPSALHHPSIVTVCGMNQRKGIEELLAAFDLVSSEFPEAHLYLVGDGPDREQFERHAHTYRSSHCIHFEGYKAVPQAYMLSADIFVLASRRESFGLVLIEAREAGCSIIATDVDGIAEALDSGQAGTLVPSNSVPALAGAIRGLLSNSAERDVWRRKAREGIARFHVDRMASEMTAIYEDVLSRRCAASAPNVYTTEPIAAKVKRISAQPADDRESQAAHR